MDPRPSTNLAAIAAVSFALLTFSGMDVAMKLLAIALGTYNALFWRSGLALLMISAVHGSQRPQWPARATLRVHLLRGLITAAMAFLFFWGLARVPLAEAVALSFIAPLLALYLAAVFLGEQIGWRVIGASLIGFAGVLVMAVEKITGTYGDDMLWGFGAIIASAVLYAANLVIQRQQALLASPTEVAFFQNLIVFIVLACFAPWLALWPPAEQWPMLLLGAILSIVSSMTMAWGYARAEAKVLINLEYSVFIWAALLGWWIFAETLSWVTLAGTALIVLGCYLASRAPPVTAPQTPATIG
jgi:S-adenosylmethionine uptake transporter